MKTTNLIIFLLALLLTSGTYTAVTQVKQKSPRYVLVRTFVSTKGVPQARARAAGYQAEKFIAAKLKTGWIVQNVSATSDGYGNSCFTIVVTILKY